ncbi:M16 family metallopeptidase [Kitasatospora sp. NPDC056184]|uniref:M16 family metallopeptidase n=1 Tax=Kitasatospora sp. NPDC056184 TaxID=3345738 RepID=UPI0035DC28F1
MSPFLVPGPPPVPVRAPYQFPPVTRSGAVLAADLPGCPTAFAAVQFDAGIRSEPTSRAGLGHLLAAVLREGPGTRPAEEFASALEGLGAAWTTTLGEDSLLLSATAPADTVLQVLEQVARAARFPSFEDGPVARLRDAQSAQVRANWARPGTAAAEALGRALYRTGRPTVLPHGTTRTLGGLSAQVLRDHHGALLASGPRVVLVGDLRRIALDRAAGTAARLVPRPPDRQAAEPVGAPPSTPPEPRTPAGRDIVVVDRPGAAQAVIRVAHHLPLVARSEHSALAIAVHVLGGTVHSRLTRDLRDDRGLVYAVHAALQLTRDTGVFGVATQSAPRHAGTVVARVLDRIDELREHGVGEGELASSVDLVTGRLPIDLHTPRAVGLALCALASTGAADAFHTRRHAELAGLVPGEVRDAAREFLGTERSAVVVEGDASSVVPALDAAGLGPVRLDALGHA